MAEKKYHVVKVHESTFLSWLLTQCEDRALMNAIWHTPLGGNVEESKKNAQPLFDRERSILSGMRFGDDGNITFIVVEIPESKKCLRVVDP
jgi:hypothetical protein